MPKAKIPDWAQTIEKIELSPEALEQIAQLVANPPPPSERLKAAAQRYREFARGRR